MAAGQVQAARDNLRVAMVGAGIFAREAHLPAWLGQSGRAQVVAVSARSHASARALADALPGPVDVELEYARLLARTDIDAVDLALPIDLQPRFVEQALAAGKHVLSEKPAAPDVETARRLAALAQTSERIWMVAENWRYESTFRRAAAEINKGAIGKPIAAGWLLSSAMNAQNKYYQTPWRRTGAFPGGFLLDGGVHHVAALRLLLGEVEAVQAWVTQARADLPPADTMTATLRFVSGALATYMVTFAAALNSQPPLEIMGAAGRLRIDRGFVEWTRDGETRVEEAPARDGVENEIAAFVDAVLLGAPHLNTPEEGVADVAVVQAMLQSAATGRAVYLATL